MSGGARPAVRAGAAVMALDPSDIVVGERIGLFHPDKAAALGRLMAVDGQRDPIKVVRIAASKRPEEVKAEGGKPWRLVTGMHRLAGAKAEGLHVLAIEVKGRAEDLAELEASENLHRRPLGPIERAKFTTALVEAAQARLAREHGSLSQHQLAIKARWARVKRGEIRLDQALAEEADDTCATIAHVYGWEDAVGEALGLSRRAIHYDLALYRQVIAPFPELVAPLSQHPIVGENAGQLKAIAQIVDEALRREVIARLIADPRIGVEEAKAAVGLGWPSPSTPPLPHQKHVNAIVGGWSRLSLPQKRQFLPQFVALLTPEMKRTLRDRLNEELGDA